MFWLYHPEVLIASKNIIPNEHMTRDEQLNSLARFSLIFILLIYLFKGDMKWISFSVTILILTIILRRDSENFDDIGCSKITNNNPFGNFTVYDYYENIDKKSTCDIHVSESIETATNNINSPIVDDMYAQNINFRDFYTLPVTKVVNDQKEFALSLLGSSGSCKHNGEHCLKNENTKLNGRVFDPEGRFNLS